MPDNVTNDSTQSKPELVIPYIGTTALALSQLVW